MIQNNQELKATLDRIERFEKQVEKLRQVETNPRIMSCPRVVSLLKLTE